MTKHQAVIEPKSDSFSAFMRERVGPKWVVARRTSRIVEKYGDSVICISQKRYSALESEYEASKPDPKRDAIKGMIEALRFVSRQEMDSWAKQRVRVALAAAKAAGLSA